VSLSRSYKCLLLFPLPKGFSAHVSRLSCGGYEESGLSGTGRKSNGKYNKKKGRGRIRELKVLLIEEEVDG